MRFLYGWVVAALLVGGVGFGQAAPVKTGGDAMEAEFRTPPDSAKPRVWWHWLSGNVAPEGITADLEWMHRVGIGGFQMFDASLGVPHYMTPVVFMTPEWQKDMEHAAAEAKRLHLEMAMAASGGWSESGGPWVKPSEAMKKVVWSETRVAGPMAFAGKLAAPPGVNGTFQGFVRPMAPGDKPYYADSLVLAYRAPDGDGADAGAEVTSSDKKLDVQSIGDGNYGTSAAFTVAPRAKGWIEWTYGKPVRVRAFTLALTGSNPEGTFAWSGDGVMWTDVAKVSPSFFVRTYAFAPVEARYFRLTLDTAHMPNPHAGQPLVMQLAEAEVHGDARVNYAEDKAAFGTLHQVPGLETPEVAKADAIAVGDVVNLTGKMGPDGTLNWSVPAGRWVILRLGYSLTGKRNHPSTPEAEGYEVDKLSAEHVTSYIDQYTGMIKKAVAANYGKSFQYFLMDSWEAGEENWTDKMIAEFKKRRGYDPVPYLPVLTGHVVESAAASDGFLWDYRRTIADLLAENHYKNAVGIFQKQGLKGLYAEAMGIGLPTTGDGLLNKGQATIPMGEFWTPNVGAKDNPTRPADVMETSSAAHIYGKPLAATESFTTNGDVPGWAQSPYYLKGLADQNFARGVNRIVVHTSDHQPWVDDDHKPGITLNRYGQHYSRNITWAEQAVAWNTYLARCSYMLQKGSPVGDVAYFYGEGAPAGVPFWKTFAPSVPDGLLYDYVNADVLLHRASVVGGRLHLVGGMSYRVLVIPDEMTELTVPMLRELARLVQAGAIVYAPPVTGSPSLADKGSAGEMKRLIAQLWGTDGSASPHMLGKGKVFWDVPLNDVLTAAKVDKDFTFEMPKVLATYDYPLPNLNGPEVVWTHRHLAGKEIYFVANQRSSSVEVSTSYRGAAKGVELWHADTGKMEKAAFEVKDGRTLVTLSLDPQGSVFVVLRELGAPVAAKPVTAGAETVLATVNGPWKVTFPMRNSPAVSVEMPVLGSWTDSSDEGVKYFSGTALYTADFTLDGSALKPGAVAKLDLGRVREIAEVKVNGVSVGGILWKPPFVADIAAALKPGVNHVEVRVTNLWPNRIIGDQQPGTTVKHTFTVYPAYTASDKLMESGMMGPVRVVAY
jgi:hypothetical protein